LADILAYLQSINSAVYGKDVRSSIHDAIEQINTELENSVEALESSYALVVEENTTIIDSIQTLINNVGKPRQANTIADMTDTDAIYVYTGSESGMISGNWYYYQNDSWVNGGPYNASANSTITQGTGSKAVIVNNTDNNKAAGDFSFAAGRNTSASGLCSFAEGDETSAEGYASHTEGIGTIATGDAQRVFGRYNVEANSSFIELVGNGVSDDARSNARTLDDDGNEWLAGRLEVGPQHDYLDATKIQRYDIISDYLNSISDIKTVTGSTNQITITESTKGMVLKSMTVKFTPILSPETNDFVRIENVVINNTGDTTETFNVSFLEVINGIYGGIYDPISGQLTVTMFGNTSTWGEMAFSIDPDNYLGKRLPLPDCLYGSAGNSENTVCNVSSVYSYDQSATTHHYIYRDDVEEGYAMVVLPDDTPDDTVITVVGTLETPLVLNVDPVRLVCSGDSNIILVDKGIIESVEYYKDLVSPNVEELRRLIEDSSGIQTGYTVEEKAKLETIQQGAEVNAPAFSYIKIGDEYITAVSDNDVLELAAGANISLIKASEGKRVTIHANIDDVIVAITDEELDEICV